MRGATNAKYVEEDDLKYFNPRSSCEERLEVLCGVGVQLRISIHAPHARSDNSLLNHYHHPSVFQSTLLMRGATSSTDNAISQVSQFQSTLLMRGATGGMIKAGAITAFQSTLLMRGATESITSTVQSNKFQSTLLMRGATQDGERGPRRRIDFNPRSSCEERLACFLATNISSDFNPRSSCEERRQSSRPARLQRYFNPRSSCEERPAPTCRQKFLLSYFNPRSSCEERPTATRRA